MIYDLSNHIDLKKYEARFQYLKSKGKKVELKEVRKKRTLSQNNYLHLLLSYFGMETGYTLHESKVLFKKLSPEIFVYEKNGEKFLKSSADVDTKEMTIAIERFRNASAENGFYLPSPDDMGFLQEIEEQRRNYENKIHL
jgi:hypothetical protein